MNNVSDAFQHQHQDVFSKMQVMNQCFEFRMTHPHFLSPLPSSSILAQVEQFAKSDCGEYDRKVFLHYFSLIIAVDLHKNQLL